MFCLITFVKYFAFQSNLYLYLWLNTIQIQVIFQHIRIMKNDYNIFLTVFNSFNTADLFRQYELRKGQTILFILILSLFETQSTVTRYDVIRLNRGNKNTTSSNLVKLHQIGLIQTQRSNQYFSRAYLSLTPKGLLLKSQLKKVLNSPLIKPIK